MVNRLLHAPWPRDVLERRHSSTSIFFLAASHLEDAECLLIYIYISIYIYIYFVYLLASFFGSPRSKLEVGYPLLSSVFFEVDLGDHYAPRFVATTALGSSYTGLKRSVAKNFELLCFKGNVDVMLIYPVARASS